MNRPELLLIERIELAPALVSHLGTAGGEVGRGSGLCIAQVGYLPGHLRGSRLFSEVMLVWYLTLWAQFLRPVHAAALAPVGGWHVEVREGAIVALPSRIHTSRAGALSRAWSLRLCTHCLIRGVGLRSQGRGLVACRHVLRLDLTTILKLLDGTVFESYACRRLASRGLVVVDLVDKAFDAQAASLVEEVDVASVVRTHCRVAIVR